MAGSGDKQAKAKLCSAEIDEVAVAFGPPAGCEVITQAAHRPLLDVRPDPGRGISILTCEESKTCAQPQPGFLGIICRVLRAPGR